MNVELEEYKKKAELKDASSSELTQHSGLIPFSAYYRQPALRLRFSESEFQALATLLNKY